ncbi:hypothetical protein FOL47_007139 [Perkinsus chesapeaki]|uniref:Uncharacterized protein n=1 Tax=Perkinsus chesapeaki TaxID=330153 RepID=A0A7J6LNA6_PERCH|nr:hypothetical protein FOL47_007139 [Perkinsus chesapeaki]
MLIPLASVVLCTSAIVEADIITKLFAAYKKKFHYDFGLDDDYRMKVFGDNLRYIDESNSKGLSYTLGITSFTHLTQAEFRDMMLMKPPSVKDGTASLRQPSESQDSAQFERSLDDLPDSVNYVKRGWVTGVKDQMACGSCWTFSTTGAVEGAYMNATGELVSFSEQQLVDCNTKNFSALTRGVIGSNPPIKLTICNSVLRGCKGGWMSTAFEYIGANGLESEDVYPYTADENPCKANSTKNIIKPGELTYRNVTPNSKKALLIALALYGPVSVTVDATGDVFQHYVSGVINATDCDIRTNHAILVVGYDMNATVP